MLNTREKEGKLDFRHFEKGDLWENPTASVTQESDCASSVYKEKKIERLRQSKRQQNVLLLYAISLRSYTEATDRKLCFVCGK